MAFISINYNEGNDGDLGYQSVELHYNSKTGNKKKFFNTGNFVKDWFKMRKFMITKLLNTEAIFCKSSTVDMFIMDGAPYDSAYLHIVNDVPVLKYRNDKLPESEQQDVYNGTEFFVDENTQPTWEELKKLCK